MRVIRLTLTLGVLSLSACADSAVSTAPRSPAQGAAPSALKREVHYVNSTSGLRLTITAMYRVYGYEESSWHVIVENGTPPYTYSWDATACPRSGSGQLPYVAFTETTNNTASLFQVLAAACPDRDYFMNLNVEDGAGRRGWFSKRYRRNITYFPDGW